MAKNQDKYLKALGIHNLRHTLFEYNPWWKNGSFDIDIPNFERDAFRQAVRNVEANHGLALLINGPRRIGKTTIIYQLIRRLIEKKKVSPNGIMFFSLDDPVIQQLPPKDQGAMFESLLSQWERVAGTALRNSSKTLYCFLDEIQRLPRWELYIKRYIDLRYPIRFVISGSASHTIFRKSLESLLGRLVNISLPPFTFREFVKFHYPLNKKLLTAVAKNIFDISDEPTLKKFGLLLSSESSPGRIKVWNKYADKYAQSGGFPQIWTMRNTAERTSFVDQQFVERVTMEDLRLIKEIRRPEIFHQFLRYAFANTGQEYNLEELASLIHTTRVTLTEALPLLLQTELIQKVERFTGKPVRLRSTHAKLYAVDPILMQSITKISASLEGEERGRVAETLAHNVIRLFPGVSEVSYYRESRGKEEVDFIVRVGSKIVPIEVCYKSNMDSSHKKTIGKFMREHSRQTSFGIIVTKNNFNFTQSILEIPLPFFLLTA